jgi:hypothetical protein
MAPRAPPTRLIASSARNERCCAPLTPQPGTKPAKPSVSHRGASADSCCSGRGGPPFLGRSPRRRCLLRSRTRANWRTRGIKRAGCPCARNPRP